MINVGEDRPKSINNQTFIQYYMDDYKQNSYRGNKGYGEKIQGDKKKVK